MFDGCTSSIFQNSREKYESALYIEMNKQWYLILFKASQERKMVGHYTFVVHQVGGL